MPPASVGVLALEGEQLNVLAGPAVESAMVACGTSNTSRVYACCAETLATNANSNTNNTDVGTLITVGATSRRAIDKGVREGGRERGRERERGEREM